MDGPVNPFGICGLSACNCRWAMSVGLGYLSGGDAVSHVTQLGGEASLDRRFSYCLVPHSVNTSSALNFGTLANVTELGAASTPLVAGDVDTYYTVVLDFVKVGNKTVASAASSRITVDSGNAKISFVTPANCNRKQTEQAIPDLTLEFGGGGGRAAVALKPENASVTVQEGTLCLAMVATTKQQSVSILGNLAQQNIHVGYDLDAGMVTFATADCAGNGRPTEQTSGGQARCGRGRWRRRGAGRGERGCRRRRRPWPQFSRPRRQRRRRRECVSAGQRRAKQAVKGRAGTTPKTASSRAGATGRLSLLKRRRRRRLPYLVTTNVSSSSSPPPQPPPGPLRGSDPEVARAATGCRTSSPPASRPAERREVRGRDEEGREEEEEMTWHSDMWGPRGSHADSATTSDKTGVKTPEDLK
uniref:Peptidase A1 domain-containing protein n=1 Tax=Oryza meridionalis TaxID=40149 RepID=A0A0E0EIX9_9ORYZ